MKQAYSSQRGQLRGRRATGTHGRQEERVSTGRRQIRMFRALTLPLFRACVRVSQRTSGGTGDELQSRPDGRDDRGGASDDGPGALAALAAAALSLSTSPRRLASWLSFRWWRCCAIGMLLLLLLPLVLLLVAASACERVLEWAAAVAVASAGRAWLLQLRVWTAPLSLLSLAASAWKAAMRSRRDMEEVRGGMECAVHAPFDAADPLSLTLDATGDLREPAGDCGCACLLVPSGAGWWRSSG